MLCWEELVVGALVWREGGSWAPHQGPQQERVEPDQCGRGGVRSLDSTTWEFTADVCEIRLSRFELELSRAVDGTLEAQKCVVGPDAYQRRGPGQRPHVVSKASLTHSR